MAARNNTSGSKWERRIPSSHQGSLIDMALHLALRTALKVLRTTINIVLHREGISTPRIAIEGFRLWLAIRLYLFDDRHPLQLTASEYPNVGTIGAKRSQDYLRDLKSRWLDFNASCVIASSKADEKIVARRLFSWFQELDLKTCHKSHLN